jgi:hypothetical protein
MYFQTFRLWIGPMLTPGPPIQISYVNTVPGMVRKGGFLREAQFERLPQVLDALNKMFKENPLPGNVDVIQNKNMISFEGERKPQMTSLCIVDWKTPESE